MTDSPETRIQTKPARPAGGTESILLVEDESVVRTFVESVLMRAGYQVISQADSSEAAQWLATAGVVDLLITDVKMPGMHGHALSEHARRVRPNLPVLFISGYSKETLPLAPDGHQATAFLAKPFTPFDLLRKVRQSWTSNIAPHTNSTGSRQTDNPQCGLCR